MNPLDGLALFGALLYGGLILKYLLVRDKRG